MRMRNPFRYGSRVTGGAFFDRERIIRDMLDVIDGGNNIVLYGPRRYGKSSLVGEIMSRLRGKGWVCAEVNLMDVASLEDFRRIPKWRLHACRPAACIPSCIKIKEKPQ